MAYWLDSPKEAGPADRALSRAVKGARYAVRLESQDQVSRAGDAISGGVG